MRPFYLIILSSTLGAILIGLSVALIRFSQEVPRTEPPASPSASIPSPFDTPEPEQVTIEEFMNQYFEALNNHDFDTAYAFLSPAWGVDRQAYQRYWSQFKAGSIRSRVVATAQPSSKFATVTLIWSGNHAGGNVEIKFRCWLRTNSTSDRIDRCQQTVLRGIAPR